MGRRTWAAATESLGCIGLSACGRGVASFRPCRAAEGGERCRSCGAAACWERGVLWGARLAVGLDCGPRGSRGLLPGAPEAGLCAARLSGHCGPAGMGPSRILGLLALWRYRLVGGRRERGCLLELLAGGGVLPGGAIGGRAVRNGCWKDLAGEE
ncbi:hypothetical protein NDU88_008338 [Pleurodeles waltl]|uniref:Uncharacterized protein n=1 Tax=Pleurodeles waltl TaxID=8319 RepID=A0AAV7RS19_PLEWA|nr:hypothetical protein NDU88_008338 [Pleurodeles waltl]